MFGRLRREEPPPRTCLPEERDGGSVRSEIQKLQHEEAALKAEYEERKQVLEHLQKQEEKLYENMKESQELQSSVDMFLKSKEADQMFEKAERERKVVLQKETEIEKLKDEHAELIKRKQKLHNQMLRCSVYKDFMEQVLEITKFEDVEALMSHVESLLHLRGQLCQRENKSQEQADQQRKALLALEDQHNLLRLEKDNLLTQLQTQLEKTQSEALTWEKRWNHIQQTATKKTLELGQIKMATLYLFETTGGHIGGEEGVDMNDTEKQLDQIVLKVTVKAQVI
ncbi:coiled-coil domain-containing protein 42 homolog [Pholidichthys leucotaenia]